MTFDPQRLEQAIAAALRYVLSMQAEDGAWTEWNLPPGPSSAWTTAYVGYQLRCLPPALRLQAAPHLAAAARWQSGHALVEGGWGYNDLVGPDADSTSYAILFLASIGHSVPEQAYAWLAGLQNADGGFATYPRLGESNSWNISHPDVTPMALLALLTQPVPDRARIKRGAAYVRRQMTPQGLWHSFWWRSDLYGTWASLSLMRVLGAQLPPATALQEMRPANAFETALWLCSMGHLGCDVPVERVERLLGEQQPDGSWPSAPILRITRRDCAAPWDSDAAGQLYAEPHRLFTTVTALHALIKISGH